MMSVSTGYDSTDEYCCEDIPVGVWAYTRAGARPYKRCSKQHYDEKETQVAMIENNAPLIIPSIIESSSSSSASSSSSSAAESPTLTDCENHCGARLRSSHAAVQLDHNTLCPKHKISCFLCGVYPLTNEQLWTTHIAGGQCPNYVIYCSSFSCERTEDKAATERWRAQRAESKENEGSKQKHTCKKLLNRSPAQAAEAMARASGFVTFLTTNKYPMNLFGWGGCDLNGGNCSFAPNSEGDNSDSSGNNAAQGSQQRKILSDFRNDHAHHTYARHAWETRRFFSQSCVNYTNDPHFQLSHNCHPIIATNSSTPLSSSSSSAACSIAQDVTPRDAKSLPPASHVASLEVCPHCSVRMMVFLCNSSGPTSLLHPAPLQHSDRYWAPYHEVHVETKPFEQQMKDNLMCSRTEFEEHVKACTISSQQLEAIRSQVPHGSFLSTHRHIPNMDHILRDVHTHEVYDQAEGSIGSRAGTSKFYPRNPDWNWLKSAEQRKLDEEASKNIGYSQQANLRSRQIQSHIVAQSSPTIVATTTASSSPITENAVAAATSPDSSVHEEFDVVSVFWTYSQCLVQNLLLELGQLAMRGQHGRYFEGRAAWVMRCEESDDEEMEEKEEEEEASGQRFAALEPELKGVMSGELEEKSNQARILSRLPPTATATDTNNNNPDKRNPSTSAVPLAPVDSLDLFMTSVDGSETVLRGSQSHALVPTPTAVAPSPPPSASSQPLATTTTTTKNTNAKYRRPKHALFNDQFSRALEIMALTLFKQGANTSDLILPYRTRAGKSKSPYATGDEFDERYHRWSNSQPRFLNANEFLSNLSRLQRPLVYPFVEQVMIPDLANMVLEYF